MAESTDPITVPMEVVYTPAWLSWVAAATACLNALGVKCDHTDVAGMTGYAFVMSVSPDLCPSGPTMFDWGMLNMGVNSLGRSCTTFGSGDCHTGKFINERTTAHCRPAFELAKSEVKGGRPVVLWGANLPEFATVYSIEGENYLVKSWKPSMGEEDTAIPWDKVDAPGGPYVMAFPTQADPPHRQLHGDRMAIRRGVQLLTRESMFHTHATGLKAYDNWTAGLENNTAHPFGNAYNTQCWAEAKGFAQGFLQRVALRNPRLQLCLKQPQKPTIR